MADDTDLAAIRDWVAQGGKITVDKEGNPVLPSGVLADDDAPTQPIPAAPAAPAPAEPETVKPPAAPKQAQQAAPKQPAQTKPKPRSRDPWYERLSDWVGERAASAPTPGGNLALLLILLFFAFAIIPVNAGKTRLQLIWLVLTGGADLPGQGAASGPTATQQVELQAILSGVGTGIGATLGVPQLGALIGQSGGGPGGPNAAGYIPPSQQSGAGAIGGYGGLLESPR